MKDNMLQNADMMRLRDLLHPPVCQHTAHHNIRSELHKIRS